MEGDESVQLAAELQNEEEIEATASGRKNEDPGKDIHDDLVVSAVVQKAMEWAKDKHIIFDQKDLKSALAIFPKVV
jgi:hypothetical protein